MITKVQVFSFDLLFILKILKCTGNANVDESFVMILFNFNDMHHSFKFFVEHFAKY